MKILQAILGSFVALCLFAQCSDNPKPDTSGIFIKFIGGVQNESAYALAEITDSPSSEEGFVIVGGSASFGENRGIIVTKTDLNGNRDWQRTIFDPTANQEGKDVIIIGENIFVLGYREYSTNQPDSTRFLVLRLPLNGDTNNAQTWILGSQDLDPAGNFHISYSTKDNALLLLANTTQANTSTDTETSQMHFLKAIIANDNELVPMTEQSHGILNQTDEVGSILVDELEDNIYWCGTFVRNFENPETKLNPDFDAIVVKTNLFGNLLWAFPLKQNDNRDQIARDIQPAGDGSFIVIGTEEEALDSNGTDIFLAKIDPSGVVIWTTSLGQSEMDEEGFSITPLSQGGFAIIGSIKEEGEGNNKRKDILLMMVDDSGNPVGDPITFGSAKGDDVGRLIIQSRIDMGLGIVADVFFGKEPINDESIQGENNVIGFIKTNVNGEIP